MSETPLVQVRQVAFNYESRPVLEQVDLDILPHDYLIIIGPNGGGKTTLVKLILGLLRPHAGKIIYHLEQGRRGIGYMPQFSTFDWQFPLLVRDVIRMGRLSRRGLLHGFRPEDEAAVAAIARRMKIEHLLGEVIGKLSGGELQRVLIARALVADPEMLILDEPTAAIDADSRNVLSKILEELSQRIPVVMITHDATAVTAGIKRVACVNRRLYLHDSGEVPQETLEKVYGCPVELIAHGVPHRVLREHPHRP